jgi:HEAT repeat protein
MLVTVGDDGITTPIEPAGVKQVKDYLAGSEWNDRRFAVAALAGVARNGETEDAALARPWLESEHRDVREAAALALAHAGTQHDAAKLLALSQRPGGDVFDRAALSLSPGLTGSALTLLDSSQQGSALLGAQHLYSHASELSDETLELLLHHTTDDVRRVGVACALRRHDSDGLDDLIDRYTSAGSYYYNVVVWLDRAVHAPPYLRERTRDALATFASGVHAPEPPASSSVRRAALLAFLSRTSGR